MCFGELCGECRDPVAGGGGHVGQSLRFHTSMPGAVRRRHAMLPAIRSHPPAPRQPPRAGTIASDEPLSSTVVPADRWRLVPRVWPTVSGTARV
ncbi:hypothetical protein GCM10023107_63590 [Actinoplanes octamycinicus]|nr:hypothetical protein Aoc01nite_14130 [Actinoplanes octamycinicus]